MGNSDVFQFLFPRTHFFFGNFQLFGDGKTLRVSGFGKQRFQGVRRNRVGKGEDKMDAVRQFGFGKGGVGSCAPGKDERMRKVFSEKRVDGACHLLKAAVQLVQPIYQFLLLCNILIKFFRGRYRVL